ncbi:uncharacterized protein METZ01_LOCUS242447, partial [marine metagenome]
RRQSRRYACEAEQPAQGGAGSRCHALLVFLVQEACPGFETPSSSHHEGSPGHCHRGSLQGGREHLAQGGGRSRIRDERNWPCVPARFPTRLLRHLPKEPKHGQFHLGGSVRQRDAGCGHAAL